MISDHVLDLQVFDVDRVVGLNQCASSLVQKVLSLILRLGVLFLKHQHSLLSAVAPQLPSSYFALNNPKFCLAPSIPLVVSFVDNLTPPNRTVNT